MILQLTQIVLASMISPARACPFPANRNRGAHNARLAFSQELAIFAALEEVVAKTGKNRLGDSTFSGLAMDMTDYLILSTVVLALTVLGMYFRLRRLRQSRDRARRDLQQAHAFCAELRHGITPEWLVKNVELTEAFPELVDRTFGISRDCLASVLGGTVVGGTSTHEGWILGMLAKRASRMFEFGTCTGRTTYLWAVNSSPDARIATLTLHPSSVDKYCVSQNDDEGDINYALKESKFSEFYYTGTEVAHKVEQLFEDSKQFDESPYVGECDLIFVDGSHAYSYVISDTCKALRMLKPGGILLWHDYRGKATAGGVFRALNELSATLPLVRIADTSLVVYRSPAKTDRNHSNAAPSRINVPEFWSRTLPAMDALPANCADQN